MTIKKGYTNYSQLRICECYLGFSRLKGWGWIVLGSNPASFYYWLVLSGQLNCLASVSPLVSKYNNIHWCIPLGIRENGCGPREYAAHSRHAVMIIIITHLLYSPSAFWEDSFQTATRLWRPSMATGLLAWMKSSADPSLLYQSHDRLTCSHISYFLYWPHTQRVHSLSWDRYANDWYYLTLFPFKFPNVNCSHPESKVSQIHLWWIAYLVPFLFCKKINK